jgi:hypothetical protein
MASKALANDIWDANTASYILADCPRDEEIERHLQLVEDLILTLDAADAFIEDLISLHVRRNALLGALSIHRRMRRKSIVNLEAWRRCRAETNHVAHDCVAQPDMTTGAGERELDCEG